MRGSAIDQTPEDVPVIVGVDGSTRSADALALANVLGPVLGRPVVIAFVHPYGELRSLLGDGEYEQLVRETAEATLAKVGEHLPSVSQRRMQLVSDASASAGLHRLAERERAALIVIGPSRRSRIGQVLAGATAERLLSGAPAPVAVAPAGYASEERRIEAVGCGFDGSSEASAALEWAAAFARRAAAELRLLSVHQPVPYARVAVRGGLPTTSVNTLLREQRKSELDRAVATLGSEAPASSELLEGNAADVLVRASQDLDLLVLGSRGYGPRRAVLLGSVSSELMRSARAPVVVVPRGLDAASGGSRSE